LIIFKAITAILNQITHNMLPINLDSKSKVPEDYWGKGSSEADVIIRANELLVGVLDKNQFGATAYGLVHAVFELHGPRTAGQLLSTLSRLFTLFLQLHGFTCGIDDMLLIDEVEKSRSKMVKEANQMGQKIGAQLSKTDETDRDGVRLGVSRLWRSEVDRWNLDGKMRAAMHQYTSDIISTCLPKGQVKKFPQNYLSLMTISGAKGSNVNFSQISCLLGQQELEGKRVPVMASGKSLPCFDAYDPSSRAGGFVKDRFLTGLKPQEYFFHCMAGREGLIDTAVKTSRSGYLQRCLIKHLEGLRVHYDNTVRDSDGSVIQFNYGEDSVDVVKSSYLGKLTFLAQNVDNFLHRYKHILQSHKDKEGRFDFKKAVKYLKKTIGKEEDPVMSVYNPDEFVGSVSEKFHRQLEEYIEKNPDNLLKSDTNPNGVSPSKFKTLMYIKYNRSMVAPGMRKFAEISWIIER